MNGQQLKNSILQMAVQGKLVPQDPNDEPASVLIQRIREEKEKLIKEKKIKKEKNPSYIFRGSDNLHYEKFGNNEPICIEDKLPFEIPNSWEWVRLATVGEWGSGSTPSRTHPEYYGGDIPWLKTGDLNDDYIVHIPESITKEALEKTSVRLNPKDSVLIAMYGATIGKLGILTYPATTNQACCACLPIEGVYNKFLFYFLMSHKTAFIKRGEGGAQPNISKEKIISTLMPLPPLSEQKRIVAKIEEILPHIDEYDTKVSELIELNDSFPERFKKSILQEAVQGKLVPQDPSDEPASILLEKIAKEKEKLIKEGKIKKQKSLPPITEDEIPFDIPNSWEWVRLGNIATLTMGQSPKGTAVHEGGDGIEFHQGKICFTQKYLCKSSQKTNEPNKIVEPNTLLLCVRAPVGTVNITQRRICIGRGLCGINIHSGMDSDFMFYWLTCLKNDFIKKATGTTFIAITGNIIEEELIPLPPLEEQKRIVAKIEELMPLIEEFSKA